ncbi:MAG: hypothetical protein EOM85_00695 [Candidatus Moranbacteria bacterium]|nr:hypothetical protein [Candidatus Moranbacteria bacterium]
MKTIIVGISLILIVYGVIAIIFYRLFSKNKKEDPKEEEDEKIIAIRKELNFGERKLYLASTKVGGIIIYSILPLKPGEMAEFGELSSWVEISAEVAFGLLKEDDVIVNKTFIEKILSGNMITKYEPATL